MKKHSPNSLERGQVAMAVFAFTIVALLLTAIMIEVYRIYEIRSWAEMAAQNSATSAMVIGSRLSDGVRETGQDAEPCAGYVTLDPAITYNTADDIMSNYLNARMDDFSGPPVLTIEVLNTPGETVTFADYPSRGYTNNPAENRYMAGASNVWQVTDPSVAVAGVIPVETFLSGITGTDHIDVTYFAAASVVQPDNVCLP